MESVLHDDMGDDECEVNVELDDIPISGLPLAVRLMGGFLCEVMKEDWKHSDAHTAAFETALQAAAYASSSWATPSQVHHYFAAFHFTIKIMLATLFYEKKAEEAESLTADKGCIMLLWHKGEIAARNDIAFAAANLWVRCATNGRISYSNNGKVSSLFIAFLFKT